MRIMRIVLGPLRTNCYILSRDDEALIIDPGWHEDIDLVFKEIERNSLNPRYIVATHGHFDHVLGVGFLKRRFSPIFMAHEKDLNMILRAHEIAHRFLGVNAPQVPTPDYFVREGQKIFIKDLVIKVLEVPGHSPGSIALYIDPVENNVDKPVLFSGDTLFRESIGRIDIPEALPHEMIRSLRKLVNLPRQTIVYPGHGPETTIGHEIRYNEYLRELLGEELDEL